KDAAILLRFGRIYLRQRCTQQRVRTAERPRWSHCRRPKQDARLVVHRRRSHAGLPQAADRSRSGSSHASKRPPRAAEAAQVTTSHASSGNPRMPAIASQWFTAYKTRALAAAQAATVAVGKKLGLGFFLKVNYSSTIRLKLQFYLQ
ncbi:hypothetical protein BHE74_00055699, partial [Ensete ventricosum]